MASKKDIRYVELNPGILELLYQRGYRYYVRTQISKKIPGDHEPIEFKIRFYKTLLEAEIGYSDSKPVHVVSGHILDQEVMGFAKGISRCRFLVRDRGY